MSVKRTIDVSNLDSTQLSVYLAAFIMYLSWRFSKYNLVKHKGSCKLIEIAEWFHFSQTKVQSRELCHGKLGFGMAKGFFSYLERAIEGTVLLTYFLA